MFELLHGADSWGVGAPDFDCRSLPRLAIQNNRKGLTSFHYEPTGLAHGPCKSGIPSLSSMPTMEESRLTLLPDERFGRLLPALEERLDSVARSITHENLCSILDETMRRTITLAFEDSGATEGTVWILEPATESLVPAYNTGPHPERLVGRFKQPLNAGLISMVFSAEQPFLENHVFEDSNLDKTLDLMLRQRTYAMIAAPFYFLGACRGVVSCVQLTGSDSTEPDPTGFDEADKARVCFAAATLGRLIDCSVLRKAIGLS